MVPLRADEGGVLKRAGHTEATVDLCRLAGLHPVGVLAEVMDQEPYKSGKRVFVIVDNGKEVKEASMQPATGLATAALKKI